MVIGDSGIQECWRSSARDNFQHKSRNVFNEQWEKLESFSLRNAALEMYVKMGRTGIKVYLQQFCVMVAFPF